MRALRATVRRRRPLSADDLQTAAVQVGSSFVTFSPPFYGSAGVCRRMPSCPWDVCGGRPEKRTCGISVGRAVLRARMRRHSDVGQRGRGFWDGRGSAGRPGHVKYMHALPAGGAATSHRRRLRTGRRAGGRRAGPRRHRCPGGEPAEFGSAAGGRRSDHEVWPLVNARASLMSVGGRSLAGQPALARSCTVPGPSSPEHRNPDQPANKLNGIGACAGPVLPRPRIRSETYIAHGIQAFSAAGRKRVSTWTPHCLHTVCT